MQDSPSIITEVLAFKFLTVILSPKPVNVTLIVSFEAVSVNMAGIDVFLIHLLPCWLH